MTGEEVRELCEFVRVTERIRAQLVAARNMTEAFDELAELEPFLLPELTVAAEHMNEAASALTRMTVALDARYDARWPTNETEGSG